MRLSNKKDKPMLIKSLLSTALALVFVLSVTMLPKELSAQEKGQKPMAQKIVQTAGHDRLGDFAADFARYNDDILFGEVWSRNDKLSLHDRSIVTVSALIASGVLNSSLKAHLSLAKKHGVSKEEMVEIITQLAFYAGWPKAWAAFGMTKEVYGEEK